MNVLPLLERFQFVFVGTLTKHGSPRVNPVEAYLIDSHSFELLADRAAWVTYGDGQTSIRWRLGWREEKHLHVPGI